MIPDDMIREMNGRYIIIYNNLVYSPEYFLFGCARNHNKHDLCRNELFATIDAGQLPHHILLGWNTKFWYKITMINPDDKNSFPINFGCGATQKIDNRKAYVISKLYNNGVW